MLQIKNGPQIMIDDYYIRHMEDGQDELHFELPLSDSVYRTINEECRILETTEQQTFVVKTIAAGKERAKIGCQLDLRDWKADIQVEYNQKGTAAGLLTGFLPNHWTLTEEPEKDVQEREIKMRGPTPLTLALQINKTFGCAVRFDTNKRIATILWYDRNELSNAFAVDAVNLRRAPEFKGKTSGIYTRLFPIGKDGLRIGNVNNGLDYVENHTYTEDVICSVWQDSRYTDAEELKADAQKRVDIAAQPERSWKLYMIDLFRINRQKWPDMGVPIFTVFRLIDSYKGFSSDVQVIEDKVYPYYPERNELTVSTVTKSIQRTLRGIYNDIYNTNSEFFQKLFAGGIT